MNGHVNDEDDVSSTSTETMPSNRSPEPQHPVSASSSSTGVSSASRGLPKTRLTRLLFGKNSVHDILGGGNFANLLLWRSALLSGAVLLFHTLVWAFFFFSNWTLVSLMSTVLMVSLTNATHVMDRLPDTLPLLLLKEYEVKRIATNVRPLTNDVLAFVHRLAVGGNLKLVLKAMLYLYIGAKIGAWFDFFTLLYVLLLLSFVVPKLYEMYETDVDRVADLAYERSKGYYSRAGNAGRLAAAAAVAKAKAQDVNSKCSMMRSKAHRCSRLLASR
ncbi:hypothetical protein CBR_g41685 [Chara braunii]|uniref:Reticulon-like protein n=1 Tax=Chara braunii TaxID=69332 RepID=A0A388LWN1_CHABU|nr:hypothetical protein CBR_g41685 [Chara braunii]|eukprot:GBG86622.1 hypothetical protein CBR_g41685 [Chara braunii]